jgi:hypothetical protein
MSVQFNGQTKVVVTVTEMARMVGLSRARFYQLMDEGVFPPPVYSVLTRRPVFVEEMQKVCLEVRRRNCGVNGRPVLFYTRRGGALTSAPKKAHKPKLNGKPNKEHAAILDAVRALGLVSATADQVAAAVKIVFPQGITSVDESEVIRGVFVHLQRQNCSDNVGR